MITTLETETVNHICEEARREKITSSQTWGEFMEKIHWSNVFKLTFFHGGTIASLILYALGLNSVPLKWLTILWIFVVAYGTGLGSTAGAHRLWTHRSYKANLPCRILLMILFSGMGMNDIFNWVRDHRVHHKYTETNADPHNAARGFFYSHYGWLVQKRHPEFSRRAREVDMSDILADPVVMFNKKYMTQLKLIFCFILPTAIPILFWEETPTNAILTQCFIRYMLGYNGVLCTNSVAHLWGNRPYNKFINPTENYFVCIATAGEGSHNYHHTFPWDYKAAEFPYIGFNLTTAFIDAMAKLGWAYDRRQPSPEFVDKVCRRIGSKSSVDAD